MKVKGIEIAEGQRWMTCCGNCVMISMDGAATPALYRVDDGSHFGFFDEGGRIWDIRGGLATRIGSLSHLVAKEQESMGVDMASEPDRTLLTIEVSKGYEKLLNVLVAALEQAANGKGKDRHASAGVPFEDQPMSSISRTLGSVDGMLYQASKKAGESRRLQDGRAQAEILGAINYLAGVHIAYDSWFKEQLPK